MISSPQGLAGVIDALDVGGLVWQLWMIGDAEVKHGSTPAPFDLFSLLSKGLHWSIEDFLKGVGCEVCQHTASGVGVSSRLNCPSRSCGIDLSDP